MSICIYEYVLYYLISIDADILLYILNLIGAQEGVVEGNTVYAQVEVSFTLLFIIKFADIIDTLSWYSSMLDIRTIHLHKSVAPKIFKTYFCCYVVIITTYHLNKRHKLHYLTEGDI